MKINRIVAVAVATLIAVLLTGVTAAYAATDSGTGPTLAIAKVNARIAIMADYGHCSNLIYYAYGQGSDGTWWADVSGTCPGNNN